MIKFNVFMFNRFKSPSVNKYPSQDMVVKAALSKGFELYGSRRYVSASELGDEVDYDFVAPCSKEWKVRALECGFKEYGINDTYLDTNTMMILKNKDANAQIALKEDMDLHRAVFDKMREDDFRKNIWKKNTGSREATRKEIDKRLNEHRLLRIMWGKST